MRPGQFLNLLAHGVCALTSCIGMASAQAQVQGTGATRPPANFAADSFSPGNAAPAASGLPTEMWHGSSALSSPQQAIGERSALRSQPGNIQPDDIQPGPTSQPELRSSAATRVNPTNSLGSSSFGNTVGNSVGNSVVQASAAQTLDTRRAAVAPASHEAQLAPTRTPLPAKSKADEATKPKASSSTLQMFISLGSSLAIVIGLFLGVAVLYRKSLSTTLGRGLPKNVLQVLGKTTVAPRQHMLLLRFGSKLVLVSLIQGEARTISEITDPLEVDQLAGLCESHSTGSSTSSFREILTQGAKV